MAYEKKDYIEYYKLSLKVAEIDYKILKFMAAVKFVQGSALFLLWRIPDFKIYFSIKMVKANRDVGMFSLYKTVYGIVLKKMLKDYYRWPGFLLIYAIPSIRK